MVKRTPWNGLVMRSTGGAETKSNSKPEVNVELYTRSGSVA